MKCLGATIAVLAVIAVSSAAKLNIHPLSEENIALINQKAKTWKAGKNFEIHEWENVKRISSGALRNPNKRLIKSKPHDVNEAIPDTFDAREAWPKCDSIKQIRDQSNCGSCWAFAAVEAMSDRICIASNQTKQVYVSAEDLNSCCMECGYGCEGGYIDSPWDFWNEVGIVTGGLYKSKQGCKDYSLQPCEHHTNDTKFPQCSSLPEYNTPDCVPKCDDPSVSYKDSKTYGQETIILDDVQQIQLEILKNGPVETAFDVYDDFPNYKSGVYQKTSRKYLGGHAVKIIGWGTENNTPYWLIANSWNPTWGDKGYFKIIRGKDECGIEDTITAALPNLKKNMLF